MKPYHVLQVNVRRTDSSPIDPAASIHRTGGPGVLARALLHTVLRTVILFRRFAETICNTFMRTYTKVDLLSGPRAPLGHDTHRAEWINENRTCLNDGGTCHSPSYTEPSAHV